MIRRGALLVIALIGQFCPGQTLTGVVYYNNGGFSANGASQIDLVSGDKRYELSYRTSLREELTPPCRQPGAIWQVSLDLRRPDWISTLRCEGRIDERVRSVWATVRAYLDQFDSDPVRASEEHGTRRWRASPVFASFMKDAMRLDLSGYFDSGMQGQCIEVLQTADPEEARVHAGPDCYLKLKGIPVAMSFRLVRNRQTHKWEIDGTEVSKL
jgi:hypothetical protein